jgi:hypothetical protein
MFAETEVDARSIWFLIEKFRQFSNTTKMSFASLMASCHTNRSSNLSEFGICENFNKNKQTAGIQSTGFACRTGLCQSIFTRSIGQLVIARLYFTGLTCFTGLTGLTVLS